MRTRLLTLVLGCAAPASLPLALLAQTPPAPAASPVTASAAVINAGRSPPAYPVPYDPASAKQISRVIVRVLDYLEDATPVKLVDTATRKPVASLDAMPPTATLAREDFGLDSYEWGVTYAGMLHAAQVTGDPRYRDYVDTRLHALATIAAHVKKHTAPDAPEPTGPQRRVALRNMIAPRSLDDSGSLAAAMIKASRAGVRAEELRPWIDNFLRWISTSQHRLADGTLARNRPLKDALWLDDLYMSVPALTQMAVLTGERRYFDDAVKQIEGFSRRMFVPAKGLYLHGWIEGMEPKPAFHWGRANGWAIIALAELLSELPTDHPGRAGVLAQYRAHAAGLLATQGHAGLWHQLLDRTETFPETSASAMFVYALARGVNRGWLDPLAYGPCLSLGWNAVAEQVNARGQVENTCVGTGMGFDPAFYAYRPVSVYAAHGYGPVLLAGAEMITLRNAAGKAALVSDGAVQFAPSPSEH